MEYVTWEGCKKGEPNTRAAYLAKWVNDELLPGETLPPQLPRRTSVEAARIWLHQLGFTYMDKKKGTYCDGHKWKNIVEARTEYLQNIKELEECHQLPPSPDNHSDSPEEAEERRRRDDAGMRNGTDISRRVSIQCQ